MTTDLSHLDFEPVMRCEAHDEGRLLRRRCRQRATLLVTIPHEHQLPDVVVCQAHADECWRRLAEARALIALTNATDRKAVCITCHAEMTTDDDVMTRVEIAPTTEEDK